MEKNPRHVSAIKALILFFLLMILNNSVINAEESDQQFLGFDLAGYGDKGEKNWEVKGQSADVFLETIELTDVEAKVYGEEEVTVTSKKGNFDRANNKFHLEEDVVITTETGSRLTTDSLDWMQDTNVITTEDEITVERENMIATSKGAEAQPDLNKAQMLEDVIVEIETVDEEKGFKKTVITCDGPLEIDHEAQLAIFNNNVKVEDESGQIFSDVMRVFFDFKNKKIERIIANGNVKIVRGENVSYSDTAVYTASNKKVVLTGRPRLILYSEKGLEDVSLGD